MRVSGPEVNSAAPQFTRRTLAVKETVTQRFRASGAGLRAGRKDLKNTTSPFPFSGTSSVRYVGYERDRRLAELVGHGLTQTLFSASSSSPSCWVQGDSARVTAGDRGQAFPLGALLPRRSNAARRVRREEPFH